MSSNHPLPSALRPISSHGWRQKMVGSVACLGVLMGAGALALPAYASSHSDTASYAPIDPQHMSDTMRVLASDTFEGRAPGTQGEERTVAWLIQAYQQLGLEPAGDNGGWTQTVPLLRTQVGKPSVAKVSFPAETVSLEQNKDIYFSTNQAVKLIDIAQAPLVFVGYGVHAPERGWDDFKGVDLKGKVAIFLINDPDFEATKDDAAYERFNGRAMTYYGRWTYKYEEAARRGAIGALIVHDKPGASYGWETVIAPGGESFDIVRGKKDRPVLMQGWLSGDAANKLFTAAGLDLAEERVKARQTSFSPITIHNAGFSLKVPVKHVQVTSQNVLGKITGAKRPDESVMFGAHWDAYGMSTNAQGQTIIRRGAIDDGSGIAGVLEIARAFKAGPQPDRTVVFAAWTAEERGLLGSGWYAAHPLVNLQKTAANFTMDVLQMAGPSRNGFMVGAGQNTVQDDVAAAAKKQGRTMQPEAMPERGAFYRADHLPFARVGVPVVAMMDMAGYPDLRKGGVEAGKAWLVGYMACYHQACDSWSADWDVRGAAEDVALLYTVGKNLAFSKNWPEWNHTSEFYGVRESSKAQRAD